MEEFRKQGGSLCTSWLNESTSPINFAWSFCSACDTWSGEQGSGLGVCHTNKWHLWEWNLDRKPLRRGLLIGAFPFPCSCSLAQQPPQCMFEAVAHPRHGAQTSLRGAHTPADNPDQFTSVYLAACYCALNKHQKSLWLIRIRLIPADCLSLCKKGTRG